MNNLRLQETCDCSGIFALLKGIGKYSVSRGLTFGSKLTIWIMEFNKDGGT